jgi:aminocyclitol acetyltransferase
MSDFISDNIVKANGRLPVIWGIDETSKRFNLVLKTKNIEIPFFVSDMHKDNPKCAGKPVVPFSELDSAKHFVFCNSNKDFIVKRLLDKNFTDNDYAYIGKNHLKYDYLYRGVPIGKWSFGLGVLNNCIGKTSKFDCIESIGRYGSCNGKAYMNIDHKQLLSINHEFNYEVTKSCSPASGPKDFLLMENKIKIGHDVWIGANTFINASKVKSIGNGAIIAAGAVVLDDVPPYAIVGGVKAKVLKYRFSPRQIEILERVNWYDWDDEKINENKECFLDYNLFFEKFG